MKYKSARAEIRDGQWKPQQFRHIAAGLINSPNNMKHWDGELQSTHHLLVIIYQILVVCFNSGGRPVFRQDRDLHQFLDKLIREARNVGIEIPRPQMLDPNCNYRSNEEIRAHFDYIHREFAMMHDEKERVCNFVLCIMPRKDSDLYANIKYYAGKDRNTHFVFYIIIPLQSENMV